MFYCTPIIKSFMDYEYNNDHNLLPHSSYGDLPHCRAEVSPAPHGYSAQQPKNYNPKQKKPAIMKFISSKTILMAVLMINTISGVLPALSRTFTSAPAWRRTEATAVFPLMADTRMRGVQRDTLSITSTCQSAKTQML